MANTQVADSSRNDAGGRKASIDTQVAVSRREKDGGMKASTANSAEMVISGTISSQSVRR